MDAIEEAALGDDLSTPAQVKLLQTIELMATGFRLKRAVLRHRFPDATEGEIDKAFIDWLGGEDDD